MGILLVTATALEMQAALAGIVPAEKAASLAHSLSESESPVTSRQACGRTLFLLICGVGPVSAGLRLGFALGALSSESLSGILNLGLAGSYDTEKAPLGGIVGATCEIFPEFGLCIGSDIDAHGLNFAQTLTPMGEIFDRIPPFLPDTEGNGLSGFPEPAAPFLAQGLAGNKPSSGHAVIGGKPVRGSKWSRGVQPSWQRHKTFSHRNRDWPDGWGGTGSPLAGVWVPVVNKER